MLTFRLSLPRDRYPTPQQRASFYDRFLHELTTIPGIRSAGAINNLPLDGSGTSTAFAVEGQTVEAGKEPVAGFRMITPEYFSALRIPLRKGRVFDRSDALRAAAIAIVSESVARRFFGAHDPIVRLGSVRGPHLTVVGVVGDVTHWSLDAGVEPMIYVPCGQLCPPSMSVAVRTDGNLEALVSQVRTKLLRLDSDQPIFNIQEMEQLVAESLTLRRIGMSLLAGFAGLALILAVVGVYGVMAYSVAQRTHEIGIRVALGAGPADVLRLVILGGLRLGTSGTILGIGAAIVVSRFLSGMLFGVDAISVATYALVGSLALLAILAASYVPARRASALDPIIALRRE